MVVRDTIKAELIKKLRELSADYSTNIDQSTEIFYDLKISGDDFDELIEWIAQEFGTDFTDMEAQRYSPGEAEIYPLVLRIFGKRPYKSITVQDFLIAIEQGRW